MYNLRYLLIIMIGVGSLFFPANAQTIVTEQRGGPDTSGIIVSQNSSYLLAGEDIEITVTRCKSNITVQRITINGRQIDHDVKGFASARFPSGSLGVHMVPVEVVYLNELGKEQLMEHTVIYQVGQANVCIGPIKLNVLYIGVDNPIWVITSVTPNRVAVNITGGGATVTATSIGVYTVRVKSVTDECTITVTVDGKTAGASRFRTRNLPVPIATAGTYRSGNKISGKELSSVLGISAALEDFSFNVQYKTLTYRTNTYAADGSNKSFVTAGPLFTREQKNHFAQLAAGSVVVFNDILVEEPGGRKIALPAIVYLIK